MKELFAITLVVGILLLLWALKPTKKVDYSSNSSNGEKQEISIEDISIIWAKRKEAVIRLEELSRLWRNTQVIQEQSSIPHFFTAVIRDFFERHINKKPFYTGTAKTVINNLLTLLDTEGEVSSVVSGQNETESKIPENTYQMLSQVSLAEHTIHVAEEVLTIVPYSANLPIALIAALAHDIGKIPKFRKQYYALGDHPFISVTVLENIGGFKELVYADDVIQAVRDHHLKPKNYVGEMLKEADTRARRRELAEVQKKLAIIPPPDAFEKSEPNIDIDEFKKEVVDEVTIYIETSKTEPNTTNSSNQEISQTLTKQSFTHQTPSNSYQTSSSTTSITESIKPFTKKLPDNTNTKQAYKDSSYKEPEKFSDADDKIPEIFSWEPKKIKKSESVTTVSDIFINTQTATSEEEQKPEEVDIPWFNPEEFLSKVLSRVNRIINGRWLAASMPDGVVYVQPRLFWSLLVEMAAERGITELAHYENDEPMKRNYLYTVLNQIQHHKNAVETSLIKKGYFSAPFIVKMKTGETHRVLYIPLKAQEAFGISVGELERRKEGKLREIEDIYPPYRETS